jgi:isoaspartyl peptidase/L-asparaginase-like protein (Ntn-hydrolase superfamily)
VRNRGGIIRVAGSHLAVEAMRQGALLHEACRRVVERVAALPADTSDMQVGALALSNRGEIGAYSLQSGLDTARRSLLLQRRQRSFEIIGACTDACVSS